MQVKQVFGFCGAVKTCKLYGTLHRFALVEYGTEGVGHLLAIVFGGLHAELPASYFLDDNHNVPLVLKTSFD